MDYVTRAGWGARLPRGRQPYSVPASQRRGFTVHWNGPALNSGDHSKCASKVRAIQNYHMDSKGWSDIAYSFLVCPHGTAYECRGWDWDQMANGNDTVGTYDGPDRVWYTIMVMIGEGESSTPEMLQTCRELVEQGRYFGCDRRILPHSDFQVKSCPGPDLTPWCRQFDGADFPLELTLTAPISNLDVCELTPNNQIRIAGWAYDPDKPGESITIHVYVSGLLVANVTTGIERPDVNAAFGITGAHGFDTIVPAVMPMKIAVDVYALDANRAEDNALIAQRSLTVPFTA